MIRKLNLVSNLEVAKNQFLAYFGNMSNIQTKNNLFKDNKGINV